MSVYFFKTCITRKEEEFLLISGSDRYHYKYQTINITKKLINRRTLYFNTYYRSYKIDPFMITPKRGFILYFFYLSSLSQISTFS